MSDNGQTKIPLILAQDLEPKYNWFGKLDWSWFQNSGSLTSLPFFETVPDELSNIIKLSSTRQQLRLGFGPEDCTTTSGARNCTEACADPASLFTPRNLRACTALAGAALLVQNGTYAVNGSDAQTFETIGAWRIPELSSFNAMGVFAHLAQCIPESCTVPELGPCPDNVLNMNGAEIGAGNLGNFASRLGHYCDGMSLDINADIAGPGVMLSYFLQASLAVFFYLLLRASTTWIPWFVALITRQRKHEDPDTPSPTLLQKFSASDLSAAASSSLAEFQEMQAYFVMAVQIATLVSFNPSTTESPGANNDSFAAMLLNSGLAALLGVTGTACVLLAQTALQRAARLRWWYTLLVMTVVYGLALVIFTRRTQLMAPADALWRNLVDGDAPHLPSCGGNPSPRTYCRPPRETRFLDNAVAGHVLASLGGIAWLGLVCDQLAFTLPKRFPAAAQRLGLLGDRECSASWRAASSAFWVSLEFLLFCMVGYHLSVLVLIVNDVNLADGSEWSFGQLITVSLWAPTIAKFVYFNIFGVKEGFESRIASTFKITEAGGRKAADEPVVGDEILDHDARHVQTI